MHMAMMPSRDCTPKHLADGDCGSWLAVPFFVSFTIITTFVVLKMIGALIIDNFVFSLKQDGSRIQYRHTEAFVKAWGVHDPYGTGRLALWRVFEVIRALPPPLGLDPANFPNHKIRDCDLSHFILTLDLRAYRAKAADAEPTVRFHEVLGALLDATFVDVLGAGSRPVADRWSTVDESVASNSVIDIVRESMQKRARMNSGATVPGQPDGTNGVSDELVSATDNYAVYLVQRRWRRHAHVAQRVANMLTA